MMHSYLRKTVHIENVTPVLILVLMDDALVQTEKAYFLHFGVS